MKRRKSAEAPDRTVLGLPDMAHHALVVGIAAYAHVNPLPETMLVDARNVEQVITDVNVGIYTPANVSRIENATRAEILAALKALGMAS